MNSNTSYQLLWEILLQQGGVYAPSYSDTRWWLVFKIAKNLGVDAAHSDTEWEIWRKILEQQSPGVGANSDTLVELLEKISGLSQGMESRLLQAILDNDTLGDGGGAPAFSASLDFSDERNSQYIALIPL